MSIVCCAAETTGVIEKLILTYQQAGPVRCLSLMSIHERLLLAEEDIIAPCEPVNL